MKYTTSDKLLAYMTLLSGLVISIVAIWYSVAGLAAIFAAAAVPIIIMGVVLEVSKLVATVWLKWNWRRAPWHIKSYLIAAISVLMLITSMGIFGFLSKAHLDQAVPTGDVASQVMLIDEKINNERETIANARTLLGQLDKAVSDISATPDREVGGRVVSSAERALQVRRQQARDRASLTKTIEDAQSRIVKLQEEKAPIASQLRAVEAEVGPIKYVAALIYGDNPDANLLERAVRWVIIIIVLVFDPLAVTLLLASQYSFQWFRQEKQESLKLNETTSVDDEPEPESTGYVSGPWPFVVDQDNIDTSKKIDDELDFDKINAEIADLTPEVDVDQIIDTAPHENEKSKEPSLEDWNKMVAEAERAVDEERELEDHEILSEAAENEKEAMQHWKSDHPDSSLKHQRKLLEKGIISQLPWENYLRAEPDFSDDEAAEEAAKWALEQIDESKKKDSDVDGKNRSTTDQEKPRTLTGYVQNAEQNDSTIWQRVKKAKDND
jgi:hypothetical protein